MFGLRLDLESIKIVLNLLEVTLVLTTLWITTTNSVKEIIRVYRGQSFLLAIVTTTAAGIKAMEQRSISGADTAVLILFIAILPALLFVAIKPLLVRATISEESSSTFESLRLILTGIWKGILSRIGEPDTLRPSFRRYDALEQDAERAWRGYKGLPSIASGLLVFSLLVFVAFFVSFKIAAEEFALSERIGLAVSLTMNLGGLYNMILKRDIISQVIGLLVMDHGLYLAVVKIVEIPVPAAFFVLSLYFYTLITVFILVILLPKVRQHTGSIDLDRIVEQSELKG